MSGVVNYEFEVRLEFVHVAVEAMINLVLHRAEVHWRLDDVAVAGHIIGVDRLAKNL